VTDLAVVEQMTAEEYFAAPGLSYSGMKTLAISPLHYWHKYINPERQKDEPSAEMALGTALHCAVLEPGCFDDRYARQVTADEYPGAFVTVDDITSRIRELGATPRKGRKADLIEQLIGLDLDAVIWDVLKANHELMNHGKILLAKEDWRRITGMADALLAEPRLAHLLSEGQPEQCFFVTDPETGVSLKARMDWVSRYYTVDLKTFSQYRGKSIQRAIGDAIYYERYFLQAFLYSFIRSIAAGNTKISGAQTAPEYVIAFVESDEPYAVELRSLRAKSAGEVNLYWQTARTEVRGFISLYADCMKRFGDKPWRTTAEIELLTDEDVPQLAY